MLSGTALQTRQSSASRPPRCQQTSTTSNINPVKVLSLISFYKPPEKTHSFLMTLQPLTKSLLYERKHLCEPCGNCVRQPHRWTPEQRFSKSYFWTSMAAEQDRKRPKQSHCSYETFNLAIRDGCFICNAVLEDYLAKRGSETGLSLENGFVEIRFDLETLPRIRVMGSMTCLLKFTLVLHSSKADVASSFLLEVNKGWQLEILLSVFSVAW